MFPKLKHSTILKSKIQISDFFFCMKKNAFVDMDSTIILFEGQ